MQRSFIAIFATAKEMPESDLKGHVMRTLVKYVTKMPRSLEETRKEAVFSLVLDIFFLDSSALKRELWLILLSSELRFWDQIEPSYHVLHFMNSDSAGELWAGFLNELHKQCSEEDGRDVLLSVLNALIKAKGRKKTLTDAQYDQMVKDIPEVLKRDEEVLWAC